MPVNMKRFYATATPSALEIPRQQDVKLRPYDPSIVNAIAGAGKTVEQIGEEIENDELTKQVIDKTTEFENESRKQENEYLSLRGENASTLDKDSTKYIDDLTNKALEGVEDERAREAIISQITPRRKTFLNRMFTHSRKERDSSFLSSQRSRIESLNQDFVSAPDQETEQSILENMSLTVRSLGKAQGFTEDQIESSIVGQISNAVSSRATFMASSDPNSAMSYYNQNKDLILPTSRIGLVERIQGQADRRQAQFEKQRKAQRSTIVSTLPDAETYLFSTGDAAPLRNSSIQLRQLGFNEDADNVDRQIKASSMAFSYMERNSDKPFATQLQEVEGSFPVTEVEGAALQVKAKDTLNKIISANIKAFQNDPAGYVDESIPPDLTGENRIQARIENQTKLSEGLGNFTPSVLTEVEKETIKDKFEESEDSKSKLNLLRSIDNEYGAYSSSAFEEAGIPFSATIAVDLVKMTQSSGLDAQLIIAASTSKSSDIPKSKDLLPTDIKEAVYKSDVYNVYDKVSRTFSADQRYSKSVAELNQTLYNVISLTGEKEKAAILDKYIGAINDDDIMITYNRGMIKEGDVEDYLEERKEVLVNSFPDNSFPRMAASENTVWIDNPSGEGWALANTASQSLYVGANGEPITVTPSEVLGIGGTTGRRAVESPQ